MALWKLDGQEDVLCRNRCFASLTKKFSIWWDDLKTSGRLFLMKILYMWNTQWHRLYCVWNQIYNCLTIWGEEGYMYSEKTSDWILCVWSDRVWMQRINCRYIHMYILISYIIAFVLYTFKETSLYGNACSGALL